MVEMGQRFRGESIYARYLADNPERMTTLAQDLVSKNSVLVSERQGTVIGMLGFIIYSHFISGEMMAGEVFWWVEPEHRGEGPKLLSEMKKRARIAGAKHYQMIAPNEKVGRFYESLGCDFVESTYQGTL